MLTQLGGEIIAGWSQGEGFHYYYEICFWEIVDSNKYGMFLSHPYEIKVDFWTSIDLSLPNLSDMRSFLLFSCKIEQKCQMERGTSVVSTICYLMSSHFFSELPIFFQSLNHHGNWFFKLIQKLNCYGDGGNTERFPWASHLEKTNPIQGHAFEC